MLVEFSVENYRSFKDRITFSMLASDDTTHEEANVINLDDGMRLLKSAVIYGANASGKSNLIAAMDFMSSFVYLSQERKPDEPIKVDFFALDNSYKNKPSRFDVIFYVEDKKYAYGLALTTEAVVEEYLYRFDDGKQRTIFERMNTTEFNFNDEYGDNPDFQILDYFRTMDITAKNKAFLSILVMLNFKNAMDAYKWIGDFYQYTEAVPFSILRMGYFDTNSNKEVAEQYVEIAKEWVKRVDVGISDIRIDENKELFKDDYFNNGKYTWENFTKIMNHVISTHEGKNDDGTCYKVDFPFFSAESYGTRMFYLASISISEKMARGGVFIKDELNRAC